MARQKSLDAYEERYRLVFAAGALWWNDPRPNPNLLDVLSRLAVPSWCIEFGCGEGYQALFIASHGHTVTAIDLSPTAIARAKQMNKPGQQVNFMVADVTDVLSLNLDKANYDLAVDIGCLHMMVEDEDRRNYLDLARRALKAGGKFFLQQGLDLEDVSPSSGEEANQLAEAKMARAQPAGSLLPRRITTADGIKEAMLPLCPARMLSLQGYVHELEGLGFRVLSARRSGGANTPYEAIILAERA